MNVTKPPTEIEIAEAINSTTGPASDVVRRLSFQRDYLQERIYTTKQEIASVLLLMDELAEQWGDECVFRRCRDRLRALVESKG